MMDNSPASLENFREITPPGTQAGAGFQFEFYCEQCTRTWKSPYRPYRVGQLAGLTSRLMQFFGDIRSIGSTTEKLALVGATRARQGALTDAQQQAATMFSRCAQCRQGVCEDDWDTRKQSCKRCAGQGAAAPAASGSATMACPNCRVAFAGGRFCAECGFDMASTHKSCPGCSAMCLRQARFCTDCGHSF